MRASPPILVRDLSKQFGRGRRRRAALKEVSLSVEAGEVYGLLGPNGAGKTTLVKILVGLARPSQGEVRLRGLPPTLPAARRRVGYLPEGHRFPFYHTGTSALFFFGRLAGVEEGELRRRVPRLLELVGLADRGGERIGRYSKGMTQRLGLAAALIDEPEVLLLDEPTDGVDPLGRRHIRNVLLELRRLGTTIFINSHLLSEVERTCDRVAVLDRGRLVREGRVDELTDSLLRFRLRLAEAAPGPLPAVPGVQVRARNGHFELEAHDLAALNRLVDELRAGGRLIVELAPLRAELEEVFLSLLGDGQASSPLGGAAGGKVP